MSDIHQDLVACPSCGSNDVTDVRYRHDAEGFAKWAVCNSCESIKPFLKVQPIMHTPGPWKLRRRFDIHQDLGPRGGGMYVGSSGANRVMPEPIQMVNEANARLMAAAPDLLAACRAFFASENQCGASLAFVMANDAIEKATGERCK